MKRKYTLSKYAAVEWKLTEDGRFSASGYNEAKDAGYAGQCLDSLAKDFPESELLKRIIPVWKEWHLNDMKPNCLHQVGPSWTPKPVTLYHFTTKMDVYKAISAARARAEKAISAARARAEKAIDAGAVFMPTEEETRLANLKGKITRPTPDLPPELAKDYEPNGPKWKDDHYNKAQEVKMTNWLSQEEHPEGFLGKPCDVCGYKYGTKWLKVDLPESVVTEIKSWDELLK